MTATSYSTGKAILDYDKNKYQDWLRRRRLRLEQVRKQSNDLAKALRQKGLVEKKSQEEEYIKVRKVELNYWKATMLEELERKYMKAMEDYGNAHELAINEQKNLEHLLEIRDKVNLLKAQERGELAALEAERRRKIDDEKKQAPISRIKKTRKIEDLRSALVRSVKKNLIQNEPLGEKEYSIEKKPEKVYNEDFYKQENKEKINTYKVEIKQGDGDKNSDLNPIKQVIVKMTTTVGRKGTEWSKEKKSQSGSRDGSGERRSKDESSEKKSTGRSAERKKRCGSGDKKSRECSREKKSRESSRETKCRHPCRRKKIKEKIREKKDEKGKTVQGNTPKETIWINLNEIKSSSGKDSENRTSSGSGKTKESSKSSNEKLDNAVMFYDHISRSYRKSCRDYPHLVERIEPKREPHPFELAKIEEEEEIEDTKKKEEADKVRLERGREALYKEKVKKDYNYLLNKLDELSSKERKLKTEQKIPAQVFHMNDERISEKQVFHMNDERILERVKTKQKIMDTKFEEIFYDSTYNCPHIESRISPGFTHHQYEAGDPPDQPTTYLSFSPTNLKTNSPVTPSSPASSREKKTRKKTKLKKKSKNKLLLDIEKALREGKELRKSISRKQFPDESSSGDWNKIPELADAESDEGEFSQSEKEMMQPVVRVECKMVEKMAEDREVQTDFITAGEVRQEVQLQPLEIDTRLENESLAVSTSTSYKSPPSIIHSCKLREFLAYIDGLSDSEETCLKDASPSFRKKIKKVIKEMLMKKAEKLKETNENPNPNPTLEYYILKLLNMSREYVANLSVSSENISTPNITDFESRNEELEESCKTESEHCSRAETKQGEELIREMRLKRAADWEEKIRNWKAILERNINEHHPPSSETEEEPDFRQPIQLSTPVEHTKSPESKQIEKQFEDLKINLNNVDEEPRTPLTQSKYQLISQKCSERISELSTLLNKVRMDKEKLLSSTSGGSTLSLKNSERNYVREEEFSFTSHRLCTFNNFPYKSIKLEENVSNKAIVDSNSPRNSTLSSEPLPDVENELLRREIITSPFKWGQGDHSLDVASISHDLNKKPSIESVIGTFRKEMSKIKPFSLISADNYLVSESQQPRDLETDILEKLQTKDRQQHVNEYKYVEESSVDSINNALTSLGLNWAKSFLKKNEKSRAMSSSSNSEELKSSEDEEKKY